MQVIPSLSAPSCAPSTVTKIIGRKSWYVFNLLGAPFLFLLTAAALALYSPFYNSFVATVVLTQSPAVSLEIEKSQY